MSLIVCRLRPPLYRKVEDLQFRVEEESITKGDLEVFIVFINESDTRMTEICLEGRRSCAPPPPPRF